jgi:hypothetical protein
MTDLCKGCKEHFINYGHMCASSLDPVIIVENEIIYCPCMSCLVKSMCEESCDKFDTYSDHLIDFERERIKNERS